MNPFGFPADVSMKVEGGKWWLVGWDYVLARPSTGNPRVWIGSRERFRYRPDEQLSCGRVLGIVKEVWAEPGATFGLIEQDT